MERLAASLGRTDQMDRADSEASSLVLVSYLARQGRGSFLLAHRIDTGGKDLPKGKRNDHPLCSD